MLFNSLEFLFAFLPLTVLVYFLLARMRMVVAAKAFLAIASLAFYGWWDVRYLPLLLGSIIFNFVIGRELQQGRGKPLLVFGIVADLALLAWFKYVDFFIENFNLLAGGGVPLQHVVLPLGISFFTFTQIAFLVDCHRRQAAEPDFINYVLFVTFFPHLIAGPILHHKEMMPQFARLRNSRVHWANMATGIVIFSIGLFKKVVVADTFAPWATYGFDTATELTFFEAWATSLSYTFQLYYDFSGYADMAIGAALFFNIRLPLNFNSPYQSLSIQEFWRRWHMTLSRWLRDYLYIPLGGNRHGFSRQQFNMFMTMLLGGLWHGANWTFVLWGAAHGLALAVHRWWNRLGFSMPAFAAWLLTFLFVNATWVLFRAKDFASAVKVYEGMLGLNGYEVTGRFAEAVNGLAGTDLLAATAGASTWLELETATWLLVFAFVAFMLPNSQTLAARWKKPGALLLAACVGVWAYALLAAAGNAPSEFLYFDF